MLHRLGIRPNRKRPEPPSVQAGDAPLDVMAAAVIDPLFVDEATALRTLGSNFDRLAHSMERIAEAEVFKMGNIDRVADLGGGPGIIAMWLVSSGYCGTCDVYDHARNPLVLGEKWAASLGISGVRFHHKTFADLGNAKEESFDFVFAEHAVSLDYMHQSVSTNGNWLKPEDCPLLPRYVELVAAFNGLLKSAGVGLIGSGNVFPVCAAALCSALRQQNISINWCLSSNQDGLQLFINRGGTVLLETFEEDALAILSDVKDRVEFSKRDVLSLEKIFQNGRKYLDVCSEDGDTEFRCTVYQCAGMAALFQSTSTGSKTVKFFSAGSLPDLATSIMKDASKRRVLEQYVEPRVATILATS